MEKRMMYLEQVQATVKQYVNEDLMNIMKEKGYIQQGQAVTKKALFDFMRKNRDLLILLAGVDQLPNYSRSSKQELIDFCVMKANVCHVDNVHMLEEM